ncbi:MAG: S-methyl-5-thioribose-1-phosphate isomerase [Verrucomicrobiota bacterium]|nr:S-methyl-5-thioribose-1-phosphate isomerase [Verrucomicrobiota bacterium]
MRIKGTHYRTIWPHSKHPEIIQIIDQRLLPFEFKIVDLTTVQDACRAIKDMYVRGAPLIGATGAYGMYLATLEHNASHESVLRAATLLKSTRPTAVNLAWGVDRILNKLLPFANPGGHSQLALKEANLLADEEVEFSKEIGQHGLKLIQSIHAYKKGAPVNILTHCNAGWLACVDHGTATAPIYSAAAAGVPIHVWVDETRPRNQGARLTAFELAEENVAHTVIPDNTGGHLMQHGLVDIVIVGTDRTTRTGDVANKIGTYLKALAAFDNDIPFYVALTSSAFDWTMRDGLNEIPIEQRDPTEVSHMEGVHEETGNIHKVRIIPDKSPVANYGFDVTPARLVRGFITERGVCDATESGILRLFPERA